jgi:anion-transporting  ArsA/GET3 family ATPase
LSLALGLRHATLGRPAVVVTSHPLRELAASVSLAGFTEIHPVAAENLFIIHIDPRDVLNSTVRQNIPSSILVKAVLASSIYQSLIEVAPGLKEIAFLHRLRRLSEEGVDDGRRFERIIWDAPATGHFLQMLRVSRNFELYLSGPFALLGAQLATFSSDPARFSVVPVTTLEEMAVEETIELCRQLGGDLGIRAGSVVCNMTSPLAQSGQPLRDLREQLETENQDEQDLQFILSRNAIERSLFDKLKGALPAALYLVRRKAVWTTDLDLLFDLVRQMADFQQRWSS